MALGQDRKNILSAAKRNLYGIDNTTFEAEFDAGIRIMQLMRNHKDGTMLWSDDDVREMETLIQNYPHLIEDRDPSFSRNREFYNKAIGGGIFEKDYSHLSDMNHFWICYYSSVNFWSNKDAIFENNQNPEYFLSQERLYDPFWRHGIELASRLAPDENLHEQEISFCKKINDRMNQEILINTLTPPTKEMVENLHGKNLDVNALLQKNVHANTTLAKTLLMMHLGGLYVVEDQKKENPVPPYPYEGMMGDILAHGGRAIFLWNKKDPQSPANVTMVNAFFGKKRSRAAFGRSLGTHSAGFEHRYNVPDQVEESRDVSIRHNYGMNLAIGGFGKQNPGGSPIVNGGENGHMFVHLLESENNRNGVMLLGIEGSEPGKTDFTGNIHDYHARSAKFSSFMADKFGTVGAQMSGRRVDLTMYREKDLTEVLDHFGTYYEKLQKDAMKNVPEAKRKLTLLNQHLSGKHLDIQTLKDIISDVSKYSHFNINPMCQGLDKRDHVAELNFARLNQKDESIKDLFTERLSGLDGRTNKKVIVAIDRLVERITVSQKKIHGSSSPQFLRLEECTEKLQKELEKNREYQKDIDVLIKQLEEAANGYLMIKAGKRLSGKTKNRMSIAVDVLKFTGYLKEQRKREKRNDLIML